MSPQQLAAQIDHFNRELQHHQHKINEWKSKRQECIAHLERIHNHPVDPRNLRAAEQRRHDQTKWRNRRNTAEENLRNHDERARAKHEEKRKLQHRYDQLRAQQAQRR
ncbi:hypothetical protein TI39_contig271g00006 [Zymoseptoria brevis]|uniref:Uncharacterized protein n=1 Tax=Zymoseptoria brevis TaxID=1047168 RepID=A0A0F4H0D8_9PEZI|nr:hypothetical protein TI39_contig271g00006 [Zymoseptoria brevis]